METLRVERNSCRGWSKTGEGHSRTFSYKNDRKHIQETREHGNVIKFQDSVWWSFFPFRIINKNMKHSNC